VPENSGVVGMDGRSKRFSSPSRKVRETTSFNSAEVLTEIV
jgi:hypothetical protein